MKALILAGGLGTRLREETEFRPKPMVEIGGRPVIWHIMKGLANQGITEFIIATGYKSEVIREFFLNYEALTSDFTLQLGDRDSLKIHSSHDEANWTVTVLDTGLSTQTGGRVWRAWPHMGNEPFLVTYGDGLADVDIWQLRAVFEETGAWATVTAVNQPSRFGILEISPSGQVEEFREKPVSDDWVNAGFIVMDPRARDYFDADCVMETGPLVDLAADGRLSAYRHRGFWQPMDTYRETQMLNSLWASGEAPWKSW